MISILIPCYNHESYIDDCLKSIVEQTYSDIELLIIDDCSKDQSYQKLLQWSDILKRRFKNVIIKQNSINLGVTKTLNSLLKLANGDYIKIIASDDMLKQTAISDFMDFVETNAADLYFSNVALVNEDTKLSDIDFNNLNVYYQKKPHEGKNLTGLICSYNFISAPGVFIPKTTIEKYGLFDESFCIEDFEYWLRISTTGNIRYLEKVTALYRINNNSLSHYDLSEKSIKRHQKVCDSQIRIFTKYENYATHNQKRIFFNNILSTAIGVNDKHSIFVILKALKKRKLNISCFSYLKLFLVFLGIYPILKKCKILLKKI